MDDYPFFVDEAETTRAMEGAICYECYIKMAAGWLISLDLAKTGKDLPPELRKIKLPRAGKILIEKMEDKIPGLSDRLAEGKRARNRVVHELANYWAIYHMTKHAFQPIGKIPLSESIRRKLAKEMLESIQETALAMEKALLFSRDLLPKVAQFAADATQKK